MNAPRVAVLLSAYNGEKYISTQIDSVLSQEGVEVALYVRDDGSRDGTCAILREYEKDPRIHVEYGENVGFIRSFLSLMVSAGEADYYAFCDQDDEWLPRKLRTAVERLRICDETKPNLCCTEFDYYDASLTFQKHHTPARNVGFVNSLVDCVPYGFCTVINASARELICQRIPEKCCGHDWWTYMVCAARGQVVQDAAVSVRYRRHGTNVSSAGAGFLRFQIWRFKKFFAGGYFAEISAQLREFERLYGMDLTAEQRKVLSLFTEKTFAHALTKIFYPHPFRQCFTDEVFLRMCFLLGRL